MKNLNDTFFKLLFTLFLISTLVICNNYVSNMKDINRYVPLGTEAVAILDTKTGAIYSPIEKGKEIKLVCKPISNKIK